LARRKRPGNQDVGVTTAALAAESTARTLAVAMSSSIPQPQMVRPSAARHSR